MPLVDKIEYKGNRGKAFSIFLNDIEYTITHTQDNSMYNAEITYQSENENYTARITATNVYNSNNNYRASLFFNKTTNYGWLASGDSDNITDSITITFDKPIDIDKITLQPNIPASILFANKSILNVYYKNIIITTANYIKTSLSDVFTIDVVIPYAYFIKSETNYYTIANGQLTQVVDTSAGGITDLSLITPVLLQGLTEPKLVVTSEGETPSNVVLSAQVKLPPQIIIQKTDVDIQTAEELSNIIVTHTGTAIVKISCSIDSGMSWIKYDGSSWVTTELSEGMDIDTIQGLTVEQLDYITQANKVRFAFYIEPQSIDNNIVLQNIKFSMKKEGLWTSCILNTDYTYGRGTDFIEFTAKKAGDYLINYTE